MEGVSKMKKNTQSGFSLVELMVVVAIIGVLATVAIPRVNRFIAKSRTSEAQVNLSNLYTYNRNFQVEFQAYTSAFWAMGYTPEGALRYNIGWTQAPLNVDAFFQLRGIQPAAQAAPIPAGGGAYGGGAGVITTLAACPVRALTGQPCASVNGATGAAPPAIPAATSVLSATNFTAVAISQLSNNAALQDTWTISENKQLQNTVDGTQ